MTVLEIAVVVVLVATALALAYLLGSLSMNFWAQDVLAGREPRHRGPWATLKGAFRIHSSGDGSNYE